MDNTARHVALIPAAGSGQRFGAAIPKQYTLLAGKSMLVHTVQALLAFESFSQVLVVVSPDDTLADTVLAALLLKHPQRLQLAYVGGQTRADTVRNGLQAIHHAGVNTVINKVTDHTTWVWVHDAARPAIAAAQLQALHQALATNPVGAILATPVADTLKQCVATDNSTTSIRSTVPRETLWQAQTPQCFPLQLLCDALDTASKNGVNVTDEASAIEALGLQPLIVQGTSHNFKVTSPTDAVLMHAVLETVLNMQQTTQTQAQILAQTLEQEHAPLQTMSLTNAMPNIRIGEGMDVHALVAGRPLILGGVTIPHTKGLLGHSDADALLHAITDALLGAAGMGDIGRLFPDTDKQYAGADSQVLLRHAYAKVAAAGWSVANVDATIVAQSPKMAVYIPAMQTNIAKCLNVAVSQVNLKAKTNEKLGWLGREEGIETRAVLMLARVA